MPFAGKAGDAARRTGWPDHGAAAATLGAEAPHQHHPHHPRRMARLAAQGTAQDLCDQRLQQSQADLRKLEGYKRTRHGHRIFETPQGVWIRPWRREIGQAQLISEEALRAGMEEIAEISRDQHHLWAAMFSGADIKQLAMPSAFGRERRRVWPGPVLPGAVLADAGCGKVLST